MSSSCRTPPSGCWLTAEPPRAPLEPTASASEQAPDGAKPHYHARSWELFYVLDGAMEFLLDDRPSTVAGGDLVLVPPGMPHAFGAAPGSTADVLVVIAPGVDRFGYFRHLRRIALGQEPGESLAPEQDRYDVHFTDSVTWTTTRAPSSAQAASP
jgi:hypothetical protein